MGGFVVFVIGLIDLGHGLDLVQIIWIKKNPLALNHGRTTSTVPPKIEYLERKSRQGSTCHSYQYSRVNIDKRQPFTLTNGNQIRDNMYMAHLSSAQQVLVVESLNIVRHLAARARSTMPRSVLYEDLYSAGCLGLCEAALRFDPDRGIKFATFAYYRVSGAILDAIRSQLGGTRSPDSMTSYMEDLVLNPQAGRQVLAPEDRALLTKLLRALTPEDRAYLSLCEVEGRTAAGKPEGLDKMQSWYKYHSLVNRMRARL